MLISSAHRPFPFTRAGITEVVLVRDDTDGPDHGTRQELVIADRAPGVLRSSTVLTDPRQAQNADGNDLISRAKGLPTGTLIFDERVVTVATVPDTDTTP